MWTNSHASHASTPDELHATEVGHGAPRGRSSRSSPCRDSGTAAAGGPRSQRGCWPPCAALPASPPAPRRGRACRRARPRRGRRSRTRRRGPGRSAPASRSRARRGRAARPALRASGERGHARGPQHGARADALAADADAVGADVGDRAVELHVDAEPLAAGAPRRPRALRDTSASTRGPASIRITRDARGSMWRKSRSSVWRAISAIAPASSTPVGPPPTITNVSHARALGRVVARARPARTRAGCGGGSRARPRSS